MQNYVLGIESSCDETSAAIVTGDLKILSNIVLSQIDIHKEFGGVVPEIAARSHVKVIDKVVEKALAESNASAKDIALIAATTKPGLPGAVMVGRVFGDCMATALEIPFVEVNHILGHIASVPLSIGTNISKHLALVVSGGHTALYNVTATGKVTLLESTMDDAVGEAFDKVARILGLPYPGGPSIEAKAKEYNGNDLIKFIAYPNYHKQGFSYSGLKTAVLNYVNTLKQKEQAIDVPKIAASFQQEAINQLIYKCERMLSKTKHKTLCVSGGVSANSILRTQLEKVCANIKSAVYFPHKSLSGDNAAMIAAAAIFKLKV